MSRHKSGDRILFSDLKSKEKFRRIKTKKIVYL